jgi:hypothetical protein
MTTKIKFTSQFGVARYPHISSPDSKGKYADNKFKTKLVFPINDTTMQMVATIKDAANQLGKTAKQYMPIEVDEEANEIVLITKSAYAPAIFDARGNPAKGVQIGGGSVIRVMGNIVPFDKGVTLQLNQVQIKELNGFGTCGFDAIEDGYEFDQADASFQTNAMSGDDSSDEGAANGAALDI